MGWHQASPEQIDDMKEYLCDADLLRTEDQRDRGAYNLTDEEVLDIIDRNGGYDDVNGNWVDTGGAESDQVSMAPHGQWVDG